MSRLLCIGRVGPGPGSVAGLLLARISSVVGLVRAFERALGTMWTDTLDVCQAWREARLKPHSRHRASNYSLQVMGKGLFPHSTRS